MVVKPSVREGRKENRSAIIAARPVDHTKPVIAMNAMPYVTTCTGQTRTVANFVEQAAITCTNTVLAAAVR